MANWQAGEGPDALVRMLYQIDYLRERYFQDMNAGISPELAYEPLRLMSARFHELHQALQTVSLEVERPLYTLRYDPEADQVLFIFRNTPSEKIQKLLKRNRFSWSPERGAWTSKLSDNGPWSASVVEYNLSENGVPMNNPSQVCDQKALLSALEEALQAEKARSFRMAEANRIIRTEAPNHWKAAFLNLGFSEEEADLAANPPTGKKPGFGHDVVRACNARMNRLVFRMIRLENELH